MQRKFLTTLSAALSELKMCCRKTGQRGGDGWLGGGGRGSAAGRSIRDMKHMPDLSCSIYSGLNIVYCPVEAKMCVICWRCVILNVEFLLLQLMTSNQARTQNPTVGQVRINHDENISPRLLPPTHPLPARVYFISPIITSRAGPVLTLAAPEKDLTAIHQLARRTNSL